jgi:hypothetical protein
MVKVKGIDYKTVLLADIGDRVFFGQTKFVTQEQFDASADLRKAIAQKRVVVLEEGVEGAAFPVYKPFTPPAQDPAPQESTPTVSQEVEGLRKAVEDLSDKMEGVKSTPVSPALTEDMLHQIAEVVGAAIKSQGTETARVVQESFSKVEKKVSGLTVSGPSISKVITDNDSGGEHQEVYIPSVLSVTDMTSGLNLETKVVGQGDSVQNALSKLRSLTQQK